MKPNSDYLRIHRHLCQVIYTCLARLSSLASNEDRVLCSYLILETFPLIKKSSRLQTVRTASAGGRGLMKVTWIVLQASKFDGELPRILSNDCFMQNECPAWKHGLESRHSSFHNSYNQANQVCSCMIS